MEANHESAAHDDANQIFSEVRQLIADCCPTGNKHEQAIVAIEAFIIAGFDTRARIVGALRRLGFDNGHVHIVLKQETGKMDHHRWRVADGRYRLAAGTSEDD